MRIDEFFSRISKLPYLSCPEVADVDEDVGAPARIFLHVFSAISSSPPSGMSPSKKGKSRLSSKGSALKGRVRLAETASEALR
jgi:hypothetical protein